MQTNLICALWTKYIDYAKPTSSEKSKKHGDMMIDFSNILTFLVWYGITVSFLMLSYIFKKSILAFIPVVYFIIILQLTSGVPDFIENITIHRAFNFTGLGLSLVLYIVIDDIETRRKVISQVFKNR